MEENKNTTPARALPPTTYEKLQDAERANRALARAYDALKSTMKSFVENTNEMAAENESDAEKGSAGMGDWFRGRASGYRLCAESIAERIATTEQYFPTTEEEHAKTTDGEWNKKCKAILDADK